MNAEGYTRLLERQVRKHVPAHLLPELDPFLARIDASYRHYEQDRQLLDRAMELSSKELCEANLGLQRSNEALESFSYAAAHDLKNHALNIQGMVELLKKYRLNDPEKEERVMHYLEASLGDLMRVIQAFLNISRTQNQCRENVSRISLADLRVAVEMECDHLIRRKDPELHWNGSDAQVEIQEEPVRTILVNLLTNSIKYGRPGTRPRIKVEVRQEQTTTLLKVVDDGIGMDLVKNKGKLFNLFSRLKNANGEEGSGVGLYLVKRLVEERRGSLEVESTPGQGTSITIQIPPMHAQNRADHTDR